MKRRILSIVLIFVLALGMLPGTVLAAGQTVVKANNSSQLVAALKQSNTKIVLLGRDYVIGNLSLNKLENVTIEGTTGTRIVSNSSTDTVISMWNCKGITLKNVFIGHDFLPTEEDCSKGVIQIVNSDVTIIKCDIFGCGRDAICSSDSTVNVSDTFMRDCSRSIVQSGSSTMKFTNCIFSGNGYKEPDDYAIYAYGNKSSSFTFTKCIFDNKNPRFLGYKSEYYVPAYVEKDCIFYNNAWNARNGVGKDNVTTRPSINIPTYNPTPIEEFEIWFENGNSIMWGGPSKTVINGQEYGEFPNVKKEGYTFKGWYTAPTGGTRITPSTIVNLTKGEGRYDQILYAQWTRDGNAPITVTFNPYGGTLSGSSTKAVTIGEKYGTLPTPEMYGYTFDGWYTKYSGGARITASSIVTEIDNHTLYAHWTKKTICILTLDANGGKVSPTSKQYKPLAPIGTLPIPIRSGYTFKGWYSARSGGIKVTADMIIGDDDVTIYAQWTNGTSTTQNYTVTFNPNGGKVTPTTKQYTANASLTGLPTPTRAGYKFTGWYTAASGGTKVSSTNKVTKNMTLYAHWTKTAATTKVKITLNANGGKVSPASISVDKNTAYFTQLPTPTRTGYEFDGWFTAKSGGTKITSAAKATANRTIYAHWTEGVEEKDINLQVTFNPNGGTVIQKRKTVLQGTRYRDLPTPTRSGYQFQGWYTAKTGGTKVTEKTKAVKSANHTLYARWSKSALTVRTAESGHWTVYVPPYCRLALFSSQTGLSQSASNAPKAGEYAVKCTRLVTLSNGTQRYYGSFNGKNYWFQFSCEMDMD